MALFTPTYRHSNLTLPGGSFGDIGALGEAVSNIATKEKAREREEFIKNYRPELRQYGEDTRVGLQGIDRAIQEKFAGETGTDVQSLLSEYGVGKDKSIGQLSPQEQQDLGKRMQVLGGTARTGINLMDPTKESVQELVKRDILRGTGSLDLANTMSEFEGAKYDDKATILEREKLRTEQENEAKKAGIDQIERARKARVDNIGARTKQLNALTKAIGSKNTLDDTSTPDAYNAAAELAVDFWGSPGREMVTLGASKGVHPAAITKYLEDKYRDGNFFLGGKSYAFPDDDTAIAEMKALETKMKGTKGTGKLNRSLIQQLEQATSADYTPQERKALGMLSKPSMSRNLDEILRARGQEAYEGAFGKRPTKQPTPVTVKSQPSTEIGNTGLRGQLGIEGKPKTTPKTKKSETSVALPTNAKLTMGDVGLDLASEMSTEPRLPLPSPSVKGVNVNSPNIASQSSVVRPEDGYRAEQTQALRDRLTSLRQAKAKDPSIDESNILEARLRNTLSASPTVTIPDVGDVDVALEGDVGAIPREATGINRLLESRSVEAMRNPEEWLRVGGAALESAPALGVMRMPGTAVKSAGFRTVPKVSNAKVVANEEAKVANRIAELKRNKALREIRPENLRLEPSKEALAIRNRGITDGLSAKQKVDLKAFADKHGLSMGDNNSSDLLKYREWLRNNQ